jgi:hypothetical protein
MTALGLLIHAHLSQNSHVFIAQGRRGTLWQSSMRTMEWIFFEKGRDHQYVLPITKKYDKAINQFST